MKRLPFIFTAGIALVLASHPALSAGNKTVPDAQKIRSALSAAPMSVSKDATVLDWPASPDAKPVTLRVGKSGWTCLPDNPGTPGQDPMCLDKQWMKWLNAHLNKTTPDIDGIGIAYMLQGGSDASNTAPYAAKPVHGDHWVMAKPHVMVIGPGKLDPEMFSSDPHSGEHWIMFGGTPFEHLMVPVK